MKYVKKVFRFIIGLMIITSMLWGVITWDFHRGVHLYITMFSKVFSPVITYAFHKKQEKIERKMEKFSQKYMEYLYNH